jgi:hypothetical protein
VQLINKWLVIFSEHFHRELSEVGAATYIEGLKDLTVAEIERGCLRSLKEVDRMPTIAHIRRLAAPSTQEIIDDFARLGDEKRRNAPEDCPSCHGTSWKPGPLGYRRCTHDALHR